MFTQLAKVLLGITGFTAVVAFVYPFVAGGDQLGTALLFGVSAAALIGGIAAATALSDPPPERIGDAEAAVETQPPAPAPAPARPSPWPLVAAVGFVTLLAGVGAGASVGLAGFLILLVAAAGWFARSWGEHPVWTARYGQRTNERLLTPVFLPVGVMLLVGLMVISFSRVLLALPTANASSIVALVVALAILGACSLVAVRPNLGSSAVTGLVVVAGIMTVAGGVAGALAGEREFHHGAEGGHEVVEVEAVNVAFEQTELHLEAGKEAGIKFRNEEPIPHNVSIYDGAEALFKGEIITGPDDIEYEVPAMEAGTYEFRCDVHPNMKGEVVVE